MLHKSYDCSCTFRNQLWSFSMHFIVYLSFLHAYTGREMGYSQESDLWLVLTPARILRCTEDCQSQEASCACHHKLKQDFACPNLHCWCNRLLHYTNPTSSGPAEIIPTYTEGFLCQESWAILKPCGTSMKHQVTLVVKWAPLICFTLRSPPALLNSNTILNALGSKSIEYFQLLYLLLYGFFPQAKNY